MCLPLPRLTAGWWNANAAIHGLALDHDRHPGVDGESRCNVPKVPHSTKTIQPQSLPNNSTPFRIVIEDRHRYHRRAIWLLQVVVSRVSE
jgi:hypothetical protein